MDLRFLGVVLIIDLPRVDSLNNLNIITESFLFLLTSYMLT